MSARHAVESKERPAASEAAAQVGASMHSLSVDVYGSEIAPGLLLTAESVVDTPFACLAYVRAFRPELISRLRHAVVRKGRQLVAVFSFYPRRKTLVVVNRLVRLPDDILAACAARLLEQHPSMHSVQFDDLYNGEVSSYDARVRSLAWPTVDCATVELPCTYGEYLERFGSATRKNLRYCARRLERESPHLTFRIIEHEELVEPLVSAVVKLNHLRMASKGKASGMDHSYVSRLAALSKSHGVACIVMDGPTVVAGTLCTRVGNGWTLHVIAHDPKFNHVRLGLLCLLRSVEEAIGCGAARFNFLWGASDYKLLFGCKVSALHARRYYRSVGSQLLAFGDLRDCAVQSVRRRLLQWRRREGKR